MQSESSTKFALYAPQMQQHSYDIQILIKNLCCSRFTKRRTFALTAAHVQKWRGRVPIILRASVTFAFEKSRREPLECEICSDAWCQIISVHRFSPCQCSTRMHGNNFWQSENSPRTFRGSCASRRWNKNSTGKHEREIKPSDVCVCVILHASNEPSREARRYRGRYRF